MAIRSSRSHSIFVCARMHTENACVRVREQSSEHTCASVFNTQAVSRIFPSAQSNNVNRLAKHTQRRANSKCAKHVGAIKTTLRAAAGRSVMLKYAVTAASKRARAQRASLCDSLQSASTDSDSTTRQPLADDRSRSSVFSSSSTSSSSGYAFSGKCSLALDWIEECCFGLRARGSVQLRLV